MAVRISPEDGPAARTVTLRELSDRIENAFLTSGASKADLFNAALASDAGPGVFAALNRLPDRRFISVLDVWSHLADLPSTARSRAETSQDIRFDRKQR